MCLLSRQSKLANLLFTRYLAIKLSTDNISVNAIHPGGVNTALGGQNKAIFGSYPTINDIQYFLNTGVKHFINLTFPTEDLKEYNQLLEVLINAVNSINLGRTSSHHYRRHKRRGFS